MLATCEMIEVCEMNEYSDKIVVVGEEKQCHYVKPNEIYVK